MAFVTTTLETTGQPPSYTEIRDHLNFDSRSDVGKVVARLERRGLLRRAGEGRVRRIRLEP
jgi:SOS-response transcriptional repressor LexA